jgi:hypothetical protein
MWFKVSLIAAMVLMLTVGLVGTALADSPGTQGQPNQTCLSSTAPMEPGNAGTAPGSAFNENGGTAGGVYAGQQPQNSNNPNSVSQYDVACFQVSNKGP